MAPPEPLVCGAEGCEYSTPPSCPTWEQLIKVMELHVRQAHPSPGQQVPVVGGSKQERLPRPTLDIGITEADWTFFKSQWDRYKRSTRLLGQDAIDQLWACASEELGRHCHNAGATEETSEVELLMMFKKCSIREQNKLVNVVDFLNLSQETEDAASNFISKAKGQARRT